MAESFDPVLMIRELLRRVEALEQRLQEMEQRAAPAAPAAAAKRTVKAGTTNF